MELSQIDLFSGDTYLSGLPHEAFALLRREAPVFWHREPGGPGYWAVTRYRDVATVARDPATFSSNGSPRIEGFPPGDPRGSTDMMINMDPPQHNRYRGIVNKGFVPRLILQLEPYIRELIARMIDEIAGLGECEFIEALAGNLPLQVMLKILGIPQEDRDKVLHWSQRLLVKEDPDYALSDEEGLQLMQNVFGYTQQLAAEHRRFPKEDMLSLLMQAEVDGHKLTEPEFSDLFVLLMAGGHETTRILISNGMLALIHHPDQRKRLIDDPLLIPSAVEEMLRFAPPVIQMRRTASCDVELGGQKIARGDKVVMYFASANRDEKVFQNPDAFDVGRTPNKHFAFGHGVHSCVGAMLARLQARVAFEEFLHRLPDLELAGEPTRLKSNVLNGMKKMPVRFTPRAATDWLPPQARGGTRVTPDWR